MNLNRTPVSSILELDNLDSSEILEGYTDSFEGELCGDNRSRSYWHGWCNGMRDRGKMPFTWQSAALAKELIESGRFKSLFKEHSHYKA